jgi:nitrile hydratase accessory protein
VTALVLDRGARFEVPWQARLFGVTVAFLEANALPWDAFRSHLVRAIAEPAGEEAESAATVYYAAWLTAFEALIAEHTGTTGRA